MRKANAREARRLGLGAAWAAQKEKDKLMARLETSLSPLKLTSEIEPVFEFGCLCLLKCTAFAYVLYCFGSRFRPSDMKAYGLRISDKLLASFGGGFVTLFSHVF